LACREPDKARELRVRTENAELSISIPLAEEG
jgi:hypothetical protein